MEAPPLPDRLVVRLRRLVVRQLLPDHQPDAERGLCRAAVQLVQPVYRLHKLRHPDRRLHRAGHQRGLVRLGLDARDQEEPRHPRAGDATAGHDPLHGHCHPGEFRRRLWVSVQMGLEGNNPTPAPVLWTLTDPECITGNRHYRIHGSRHPGGHHPRHRQHVRRRQLQARRGVHLRRHHRQQEPLGVRVQQVHHALDQAGRVRAPDHDEHASAGAVVSVRHPVLFLRQALQEVDCQVGGS